MYNKKEKLLIHTTAKIKMIALLMKIGKYISLSTNVLYLQHKHSNIVSI